MLKRISPAEATMLHATLKRVFNKIDARGKAKTPDQPLTIGGVTVPPGACVWFVPTKYDGHSHQFRVRGRDSDHAIIFVDEDRGAVIIIDGPCETVDLRRCA